MTKRDFDLIARTIKRERENCGDLSDDTVMDGISVALASAFQRAHPRFDYERFMQSCGVDA